MQSPIVSAVYLQIMCIVMILGTSASCLSATPRKRKKRPRSRRNQSLGQTVSLPYLFTPSNLGGSDNSLTVVEDASTSNLYTVPEIPVPPSRSKAQPDSASSKVEASSSTSKEKKNDSAADIRAIREQHAKEQASGRYVALGFTNRDMLGHT